MGYYTDYDLVAYYYKNDPCCSQVITGNLHGEMLNAVEREVDQMHILDKGYENARWYVNAKWYEYEADMCLLSSKFPDVMFELSGQGEDSEDMWMAYFYQGKTQHCPAIITFDALDLKKMIPKELPQEYYYRN